MTEESQVYVKWKQGPYGVPNEHLALGEDWIVSGQAIGSLFFAGQIQMCNIKNITDGG